MLRRSCGPGYKAVRTPEKQHEPGNEGADGQQEAFRGGSVHGENSLQSRARGARSLGEMIDYPSIFDSAGRG